MPLSFADIGKTLSIKRIAGNSEIKKFLEKLGFTVGGNVTVISSNSGNLIVQIKESRVALSKETANKIYI